MKFHIDKKYLYWGLTAFFVIIAGILFYYILFHSSKLTSVLRFLVRISMPVIDGLILAYLITPVLNTVERRIIKPSFMKFNMPVTEKNKRKIRMYSIIVTDIIIILVVYGFFSMIIPELLRSIQSISIQFPTYVRNLTIWVTDLLENNPRLENTASQLLDEYSTMLKDYLNNTILPNLNELILKLSSGVIDVLKALWNFVIGFIISIYILANKELYAGQAKKMAYAFFETASANQLISNFRFIHSTFSGFVIGKIIDSAIIGVICFVCTSIIGTPYAILVSVIIGVTNVVPFFGPWLGGIPSALLILMVNPMQCLYFVILILVIQQFDGNILGPKILGDSTGLSGFWVIFAITIFGGIFGILGMVVGVPAFAVFYAGFKAVVNKLLAKKELPTQTQLYLTVGSITEDNSFVEYIPVKKEKKSMKKKKREDDIEAE